MPDSPLADALRRSVDVVSDIKEERVKDARTRAETSMPVVVHGWRGTEPVVMLMPFQVDRDDGLRAAWVAASGFGCDIITMSMDTWVATTRLNPVTGEKWQQREMQVVARDYDGLENGWITEAINTQAVNRAGDVASVIRHFTVTEHASPFGFLTYSLEWGDRHGTLDDPRWSTEGLVRDTLMKYMNAPAMDTLVARAGLRASDFGLDDVQARAHMDCAVVKLATVEQVFEGGIVLMSDDPERAEIIKTSLRGWGLKEDV